MPRPGPLLSSAGATQTGALQAEPAAPAGVDSRGIETEATVLLLVVGLLALLGDRLLKWGARLGGRLGLDTNLTLGSRIRAVQWAGALILAVLVARWLVAPLPAWMASLVVVGVLLLLFGGTGLLGDAFGGLMVQFRFRLREGDHITLGKRQGEVQEVHALQLRVRTLDGSAYIPNRHLLREPLQVAPLRHAYPLHFVMALPRPLTEDDYRILHERVVFLPYRVPGSPLQVRSGIDGGHLEVTCHLWDQRAAELAEAVLRKVCLEVLAPQT